MTDTIPTLSSYVYGTWHQPPAGASFSTLVDPSDEEPVARASSHGVDFQRVLDHARDTGGPALRELSFTQRASLLKEMSKTLRQHRDELLELSSRNTGTTTPDGSFDVDGGTGTLAWYAGWGRRLGDNPLLAEGDGTQLARSEGFWGQHVLVPRRGAAVAINAFNFPVWGFAEKAACALLAGTPLIVKPATATALVAHRAIEVLIEAGVLPEGAVQLIAGGTGDLLDRLGPLDALAFTGSAATAAKLRDRDNFRHLNVRLNVEADSLNAAVLAPDVEPGDSATFQLFLRDAAREMTQKTGQKCTAVRRVFVPEGRIGAVQEALAERLSEVVTGDPRDGSVSMGPVASAQQLDDAVAGTAELAAAARIVHGSGERVDGVGAPAGKGYFFAPTLLRADDPRGAEIVHRREVFAPVATLLPYDGSAADAADLVALGQGMLVTSAYGDDAGWLADFARGVGSYTGRLYLGTEGSAGDAPGSGIALPQSLHGGPGRAGGGEELGGIHGLAFYMQRLALQGNRPLVEELAGLTGDEDDDT